MTRRASLNVSFLPELVAIVTAQVAAGYYASAGKAVWTVLRTLERDAATRQLHTETAPS